MFYMYSISVDVDVCLVIIELLGSLQVEAYKGIFQVTQGLRLNNQLADQPPIVYIVSQLEFLKVIKSQDIPRYFDGTSIHQCTILSNPWILPRSWVVIDLCLHALQWQVPSASSKCTARIPLDPIRSDQLPFGSVSWFHWNCWSSGKLCRRRCPKTRWSSTFFQIGRNIAGVQMHVWFWLILMFCISICLYLYVYINMYIYIYDCDLLLNLFKAPRTSFWRFTSSSRLAISGHFKWRFTGAGSIIHLDLCCGQYYHVWMMSMLQKSVQRLKCVGGCLGVFLGHWCFTCGILVLSILMLEVPASWVDHWKTQHCYPVLGMPSAWIRTLQTRRRNVTMLRMKLWDIVNWKELGECRAVHLFVKPEPGNCKIDPKTCKMFCNCHL